MRLTVLGWSGSVVGPDSPACGYLLRAPDTPPLVIDFGPGVLGALQRHADPGSVHVMLSHLHADHCLDMAGLFVWRRYHPSRPDGKAMLYGPSGTSSRLGAASSPHGGEIDDCSDIFDVRPWVDGEAVTFGTLTVVPRQVAHPDETFGLRITDPAGGRWPTAPTPASATRSLSWLATPTYSSARRPGRTRRGTARTICICRALMPGGSRHRPACASWC